MMISDPTPFTHAFNFNDMQRVIHPLSASPGSSAGFRTTSPVLNPTMTNQQQPSSVSVSTTMTHAAATNGGASTFIDDVTTIFVVGFPEDMAEREFQNMFTFCHGFEAASLKWHCKDQAEEDNASTTTSAIAAGMVTAANNNKKQMIGFARFRTRLEALEAIEVLSGKKVDQDKGTVLKAEMAKKNLHIKRGSSQQQPQQGSTTSTVSSITTTPTSTISTASSLATESAAASSGAAAVSDAKATTTTSGANDDAMSASKNQSYANYDNFSPLPSDLLSPQGFKSDLFINSIIHTATGIDETPSNNTLFGNPRSALSFDDHFSQELGFLPTASRSTNYTTVHSNQTHPYYSAFHSSPSANTTSTQPGNYPYQSKFPKMMMHGSATHNNLEYLSKSSPQDMLSHPLTSSTSLLEHELLRLGHHQQQHTSQPLAHHPPHLSQNNIHHPYQHQHTNNSSPHLSHHSINVDFVRSPSFSSPMQRLSHSTSTSATTVTAAVATNNNNNSTNPADQNPPCNTLYVGNLPPNTSEEELRHIFSVKRGYRRMCFRTKPQGPMCFVEFEDIHFATQALNDLQGYQLSNSVKGGIRLSYSKNPLFIKPQPSTSHHHAQQHNSHNNQHHHHHTTQHHHSNKQHHLLMSTAATATATANAVFDA